MKKINIRRFCCFLLLISIFLCISCTAFANIPLIVDDVGILTSDEIEKLETKAENISQKYGIDTAVYFTDSFNGLNRGLYSDKYWKNSGYSDDCSIMLVALDDGEYYLYNCGDASNAITDYGLSYIEDKILPYLGDGDWYKASEKYLQYNSNFYDQYYSDGQAYDVHEEPKNNGNIFLQITLSLALGVLLSVLILSGKRREMRTVVPKYNADDYTSYKDFHLTKKSDKFIDKKLTVVPIPQQEHITRNHGGGGHDGFNGPGGTTMHSGMDGHSFSGHGGKF